MSDISTFRVEAHNMLELSWEPGAASLSVDLGVSDGTIAEEPGYSVGLTYVEAVALRDWLTKVLPPSAAPLGGKHTP